MMSMERPVGSRFPIRDEQLFDPMTIPLSEPAIGSRERDMVNSAMDSGWISGTGRRIKEFEDAFAAKVDRRYAVAVTNGTVALELVLKALGIGAGDEVIVPALTFAAPAAAVVNVGAKPVFADVSSFDWIINTYAVEALITPATKAIIAVDLMGQPFDLIGMLSVLKAQDHPVHLIEDAAQAHGARYKCGDIDLPVGKLGYVSTFSFHANKTITTGEGGAVVTDDEDLAKRVRLIANHGMTKEAPYWHEVIGTNNRMTNLTAAIGCAQVERWDDLVRARSFITSRYDYLLRNLFQRQLLFRRPEPYFAQECTWLYTVSSPHREVYLKALNEANIDARAIWPALPDVPAFKKYANGDYPIAHKVASEAFWLPTFAGMPESAFERIVEVLHATARELEPVSTA